jgi:hypothetical protein
LTFKLGEELTAPNQTEDQKRLVCRDIKEMQEKLNVRAS